VTKCHKANISVTDYCWLETVGHLIQISLNDHSSLPGFVKDRHGGQCPLIPRHLVWTSFGCTLSSDASWRTFRQEVSEFLVWRLDKHRFLPEIWSQVTVRVCNSMVRCHCCKTHNSLWTITQTFTHSNV